MSQVDRRQASIRHALTRLGARRVEHFLRAIATPDERCLAVGLINRELDEGKDLSAVLLGDRDEGYLLEVKGRGRKYRIMFGCVPGPMVGDGGTWRVEFADDESVLSCEGETMWIA